MAIYYNNQLKDFYYGGNYFSASNEQGLMYYGTVEVNPGIYGIDNDAQNFFTATGITNKGLQVAVNNLVTELKLNSLWDRMDLIYPFVADNTASLATQLVYNLKNTGSFQATLTGGTGSSNLNGYYSNNDSNIYLRSGYVPSTQRGSLTGSIHVSYYTTTPGVAFSSPQTIEFGSITSFPSNFLYGNIQKTNGTASVQFGVGGILGSYSDNSGVLDKGYLIGSYDNSLSPKLTSTIQGLLVATSSATTTGISSTQLFLGDYAAGSSYGVTKQYQFMTVGNSLTTAQATTLNSIVQNFQTAVDNTMGTSRRVY